MHRAASPRHARASTQSVTLPRHQISLQTQTQIAPWTPENILDPPLALLVPQNVLDYNNRLRSKRHR